MIRATRYLAVAAAMFVSITASAEGAAEAVDYRPQFGGVVRARWEMLTNDGRAGDNHFALRNARVWISGKVAAPIAYYLRADLCDMGKMKFLDGWARFSLPRGLNVQAGQFRIPFGVDPFRGPGSYVFINRSFIGRDMANNRAVGVQAAYTSRTSVPVQAAVGVFSNSPITNHSGWNDKMTVAAKVTVAPGNFKISGGVQSLSPDSVRINMADVAVTYAAGQFTAEAEYMYKHYAGDAFDNCHAYNVWADYGIPLRKGLFDRLSFQGRFEGCEAHSTGKRNAEGNLVADQPSRKRLTIGSTLAYKHRRMRCELQLNYEKYFYNNDYMLAPDRADKVVAELVLVF